VTQTNSSVQLITKLVHSNSMHLVQCLTYHYMSTNVFCTIKITQTTIITSFMKRKICREMYTMKNNDDHGLLSYAGIITSGKLHSNKVVIYSPGHKTCSSQTKARDTNKQNYCRNSDYCNNTTTTTTFV